jgi:hypothetical protein
VCTVCEPGYGYNIGKSPCKSCEIPSKWSNGETECLSCSTGTGGSFCTECSSKTGDCLKCSSGYGINTKTGICERCEEGKTFSNGTSCKGCKEGIGGDKCQNCNIENGKCQRCSIGFSIDSLSGRCLECEAGTYNDVGIGEMCFGCVLGNGCLSCDQKTGMCTTCPKGKVVSGYGCKDCESNTFQPIEGSSSTECETCVLESKCIGCSPTTGLCNECPNGLQPSVYKCLQMNFNATVVITFTGITPQEITPQVLETMRQDIADKLGIPESTIQIVFKPTENGFVEAHVLIIAETQERADILAETLVNLIELKQFEDSSTPMKLSNSANIPQSAAKAKTVKGSSSLMTSAGFIAAVVLGVIFAVLLAVAILIAVLIIKHKYGTTAYIKHNSVMELSELAPRMSVRSQLTASTMGGILQRPNLHLKSSPSPTSPPSSSSSPNLQPTNSTPPNTSKPNSSAKYSKHLTTPRSITPLAAQSKNSIDISNN